MMPSRRASTAFVWAVGTHSTFLLAIGSMLVALDRGLATGAGRFEGAAAWFANLALVLQFPLLHSWLLSRRGMALLARCAPFGFGRALATTTYAWIASAQLLLVFWGWSPTGRVLFEAHGAALWVSRVLYAASWLFLVRALSDAGLGLQTGFAGWRALLAEQPVRFPSFPTQGTFRLCRQPIYLGFALTLWTGSVLTLDRLCLASLWSVYCVLGPLHKEARFQRHYGESFLAWRARVPYFLPRLFA